MPDPSLRTILMADDSSDDTALMRAAVRSARTPCMLRSVDSGTSALAYLEGREPFGNRSEHPFPALLLLDLQMPGLGGMDVLEHIRGQKAEWRRLPIVMLTSVHDYAAIKRAYDLGANSFLVKPSDFEDLIRMVSDLLAYWLSHNHAAAEL